MRAQKQTSGLRCVICGSKVSVQRNHVGGQNHVAWFWMPFCQTHHDQFLAQWMMTKALQELNSRPEQNIGAEDSPQPGEPHV